MTVNGTLFGGQNPLLGGALLDFSAFTGFMPLPGGRKVRGAFKFSSNLLMVTSDRIGAFDQLHICEDGQPAHYPGKGRIINSFNLLGKQIASLITPTDYLYLNPTSLEMEPEIVERCCLVVKAEEIIPVEFVVRSSCEGSMDEKAAAGKPICGQELPKNIKLGQLLPHPYFTPSTKAPKGQKDQQLTMDQYLRSFNEDGLANYLYGMSVLLHLLNRFVALKCGLDRPDQKFEFGIFADDAPIHCHKPFKQVTWTKKNMTRIFNYLCRASGFEAEAWREMPLFNIKDFCDYAAGNHTVNAHIRLADECWGTDDGRYRLMADTIMGRKLYALGEYEHGLVFMKNYLCKEYMRLRSKETGKGGYEKAADQVVIIPNHVLEETGRRNLMCRLMMNGKKLDSVMEEAAQLLAA